LQNVLPKIKVDITDGSSRQTQCDKINQYVKGIEKVQDPKSEECFICIFARR